MKRGFIGFGGTGYGPAKGIPFADAVLFPIWDKVDRMIRILQPLSADIIFLISLPFFCIVFRKNQPEIVSV